MGQRLSEALDKNRSFVSQISNPNYKIPVPYKHLETIFTVCGFSTKQKEAFLREYYLAHPKYAKDGMGVNSEERAVILPSTGNDEVDQEIERLVVSFVNDLAMLYQKVK